MSSTPHATARRFSARLATSRSNPNRKPPKKIPRRSGAGSTKVAIDFLNVTATETVPLFEHLDGDVTSNRRCNQ